MRGPIPKRSAERRRRNKDGVEVLVVNLDETLAEEIEIPAPPMRTHVKDEETGELEELAEPEPVWHPVAEDWYLSLTRSGQAIFYEASDWATAYLLAEQIHRNLEPRPVQVGQDSEGGPVIQWMTTPMPGTTLSALLKGMAALMTTEGERRRVRIELDRKRQRDATAAAGSNVVSIAKTREDVFKREARG